MNGLRGMEQLCVNIGKLSEEEVITKLETYGLRVSARLNLEQVEGEELKLKEKMKRFATQPIEVSVYLCVNGHNETLPFCLEQMQESKVYHWIGMRPSTQSITIIFF